MVLELLTISGKICYDKFITLIIVQFLRNVERKRRIRHGYERKCALNVTLILTCMSSSNILEIASSRAEDEEGCGARLKNNSYMFLSWRDFDIPVLNIRLSFSHWIFCLSCVRLTFPVFSLLFKNACRSKCEDLTLTSF